MMISIRKLALLGFVLFVPLFAFAQTADPIAECFNALESNPELQILKGKVALGNVSGQSLGSSQIDNGQTNYYSPNGAYRGTNTATPTPSQPNTTINTPRNAPQAPVMKG